MRRSPIALGVGALCLAAVAVGCRGERPTEPALPPADATTAALAVFELARVDDPDRDTVTLVFDAARLTESMAGVLDAIAPLAETSRPRVIAELAMPEVQRVAVDIEADLPGGGNAIFGVQSERRPDGTWRVVSVLGPGVEWPIRSPGRDSGTTTSSTP